MKPEPIEWKPRTWSDVGIIISSSASANDEGEIYTLCPKCSATRKPQNQNKKCLGVNLNEGMWNCMNCDNKGSLFSMTEEQREQNKAYHEQQRQIAEKEGRTYEPKPRIKPNASEAKPVKKAIPEQKTEPLTNEWLKWLSSRGISKATAVSNKLSNTIQYMPQTGQRESALCFNYYKNDVVVNIKYRDANKNFMQTKNTERTVYGYDDIDQDLPLIWVEGEMDKLSVYEAGFTNCISVPDGAPAPNAKNVSKKFEFLLGIEDKIKNIKTHIIAVDNDEPGIKLREELARRLGLAKCKIVYWGAGIKDANDALMGVNADFLRSEIEQAKYYPIKGVIDFSDNEESLLELYHNGLNSGLKAGYDGFDDLYSVGDGGFTVVTGAPGSGKSEMLDNIILKLAKNYGFKTLIFSPENQPVEMHKAKLLEKWLGVNFYSDTYGSRMTPEKLMEQMKVLSQYLTFTLPESPTIEKILRIAKLEIYRKGINGLIIDPWNEIAHERNGNISETEYIGEALRILRKFARDNKIHLWIVAHPTKLRKNPDGTYEVATLYDINGSANWNNKADMGISVYRGQGYTDVHVQKVRMKHMGKLGVQRFIYNQNSGTYRPVFNSEEF